MGISMDVGTRFPGGGIRRLISSIEWFTDIAEFDPWCEVSRAMSPIDASTNTTTLVTKELVMSEKDGEFAVKLIDDVLSSLDDPELKKIVDKAMKESFEWSKIAQSARNAVSDSVYGQHDASWLSFYDYFREVCGLVEETKKLQGLWEVAKSANWWLPHQNICWVSERHNTIKRDEDGRLHCEDGPALTYPDGSSMWSIHEVRVDEQIIMRPETQTIEQIEKEVDEEKRRVRIERFGWTRYLTQSNAEIIDSRVNDVDGTEERLFKLPDGSLRLLCACKSTARVYAVGVDRTITKCEQAQAWMAGGSSLAGKGNTIGAS